MQWRDLKALVDHVSEGGEGDPQVRGVSYDSRNGGAIPRDNIIGKAWIIIWPIGDWGFAPNEAVAFAETN